MLTTNNFVTLLLIKKKLNEREKKQKNLKLLQTFTNLAVQVL